MELAAQEKGELHKVVWACSSQQVGNFEGFQALHPLGWLLSSKAPYCDMKAAVPSSRPAGISSQTSNHLLASGRSEGGPTYDSYRCKAQRLTAVCSAHWL